MKKSVSEMASPAKNRGGDKAGSPGSSSNNAAAELTLPAQAMVLLNEFDGASVPSEWVERLRQRAYQRRADPPLVTSEEYERAITACMAEHEARQQRRPGNHALASSFLELRHWVCLAVSLAGLGILVWLLLEAANEAISLLASAAGR